MSKAANRAKTKWNSSHYAQIKASVHPELAASFKAACAAAGVSMASALSSMMAEYAAVAVENQYIGKKTEADPVSTMKKRRIAVRTVTRLLEQVLDAEGRFIGNAPSNLQSAPIYELAEQYVSVLENVIEQLDEIY